MPRSAAGVAPHQGTHVRLAPCLLGSLILGALGAGEAAGQLTPLPPTSTPKVDRLLADLEEAYRNKDAQRFVALFTQDVTQIDVNRRVEVHGRESWLQQTNDVNAVHREMSRVHRGRVVNGNLVFVEIEWAGTVVGSVFGPGRPDRPYRFAGFGLLELAGDMIRRQVVFIDYATFREQVESPIAVEGSSIQTPPLGKRFDVGGRRMHLHCLGDGPPTVVVDQGAGGWSVHWMHLHAELARTSRVCLYDRAGLGWSDPSSGPRTSTRAADDLARLLESAQEQRPFVLVGHSYGGYVARVFRARYPELVGGLVLVESGHEDQWTRLPPPLTEITQGALAGLREVAAALRAGQAIPAQPLDSGFRDPRQRQLLEAASQSPAPYDELAGVIEAMDQSTAATRQSGSLGDLPLVVITARRSFDAFRHLPIDVVASNAVWSQLQGELASLSSCTRHLWSEVGDHNIQLTDQKAVVEGIAAVVRALSTPGDGGCPLRQSRAPDGTADSAPAWFRRHIEGLTRDSGRWIADNAGFISQSEPWDHYGLEWTWGLGRHSVKGRLYAIKAGKDVEVSSSIGSCGIPGSGGQCSSSTAATGRMDGVSSIRRGRTGPRSSRHSISPTGKPFEPDMGIGWQAM